MSATVRLSSKLPGDEEINGLDAHVSHLFDSEEVTVALVWLVPSKVTEDLETGARVPTVEVRRIEPIGPVSDTPDEIRKLAADLYEKRTMRNPLPFDSLVAPEGDVEEVAESDDEAVVKDGPRLSQDPSQIGEVYTFDRPGDEE